MAIDVSHIIKVMPDARSEVDLMGLMANRVRVEAMPRAHLHPEVEFNLILSGAAGYETGTGWMQVPTGRLVAFWGGYPHRMRATADGDMLWATVPLSALHGHHALAGTVETLLTGRMLQGPAGEATRDRALMRRWADDLPGDPAHRMACLLEMQARLVRLAVDVRQVTRAHGRDLGAAERVLGVIARCYPDDVSVPEIARRADVHPTYAAQAFKAAFGMSIWQYVTRLRVAHAGRLLGSTDWNVDRIAYDSGFQTVSSFYRAFGRETGSTPTRHRGQQAEASGLHASPRSGLRVSALVTTRRSMRAPATSS